MRTSNNFLELLSSELNLAVTKLVLGSWLRLELLLDNTIVCLLLTGTHSVKVCRCWLILSNGLINIEWVDFFDEFKLRLSQEVLDAKVDVILNLFKGHGRCSLSLLDLLSDTGVFLSINSLMLHQVVESLLVSSDSQVLLDFFLFIFKLVVIEIIQHFDSICSFLALLPIDLSLGCFIVSGELALGLEVLALGGWSTKNLTLGSETV